MSWTRTSEDNWFYVLRARWDDTGASAVPPSTLDINLGDTAISKISGDWQQNYSYPIHTTKWARDVMSLGGFHHSKEYRQYTYAIITGLPDFDANGFLYTYNTSGENMGAQFRMSWMQNLYETPDSDPTVSITSNGYSNSANGSYADYVSFWLNSYPSTAFFSIKATANLKARFERLSGGHIVGDITEVLYNRNLAPVSLAGEGIYLANIGEMGIPYVGTHTLESLSHAITWKPFWPWLALSSVSADTDIGDRNFRNGHFKINCAISTYTMVLEDLTNRYKTSVLVAAQSEEYVNEKYELFDQLLQVTIEVPKEFRVRSQTSPTFDMSKLSSMAMPSDTNTTTPTPSITPGGSSY